MTVRDGEVEVLATAVRKLPGLPNAVSSDEKSLSNLPYCVLSAIYSIGATHKAWSNVVERYRRYYDLPPQHVQAQAPDAEPTISRFVVQIQSMGPERFANEVLDNIRPTSSSPTAPLRSEAALDYARVLKSRGIERIEDLLAYSDREGLFAALRKVNGQGSGISTKWFFMKAGDTRLVKLDRHLDHFLTRTLHRVVTQPEAEELFTALCRQLEPEYPSISPRALDLLVWQTERARNH